MGARIEAVATARSRRGVLARGGRRLSDAAARICLDRAGHDARELDVLVNAGMYKERCLAEPALASIIQEDIGANPGHPPRRDHHGTFSFDVMNGGCGFLTAAHLVSAIVGAGDAELGLIVAADAEPLHGRSYGFPFASVGGAVLLEHHDDGEGFVAFDFRAFPELADLFEVRLRFEARVPGALHRRGRNVLDVHESPSFAHRAVECAAKVATEFLEHAALGAGDVDLLLTSQYPASFADEIARALGIPSDRLPRVDPELALAHTAGPIAALESSIASGCFARAHRVLFVTAGAGIAIGAALYRK